MSVFPTIKFEFSNSLSNSSEASSLLSIFLLYLTMFLEKSITPFSLGNSLFILETFIPSIGKPGGCNPVPIEDWQQTETEILINRTSLEEGLNLFSTIVEIDVKDPISGAQMKNTKTEHKYNYEGKTYFFESEKNLDLFRDNPEKYLGKGE